MQRQRLSTENMGGDVMVPMPGATLARLADIIDHDYIAEDHTSIFHDIEQYLKAPSARGAVLLGGQGRSQHLRPRAAQRVPPGRVRRDRRQLSAAADHPRRSDRRVLLRLRPGAHGDAARRGAQEAPLAGPRRAVADRPRRAVQTDERRADRHDRRGACGRRWRSLPKGATPSVWNSSRRSRITLLLVGCSGEGVRCVNDGLLLVCPPCIAVRSLQHEAARVTCGHHFSVSSSRDVPPAA